MASLPNQGAWGVINQGAWQNISGAESSSSTSISVSISKTSSSVSVTKTSSSWSSISVTKTSSSISLTKTSSSCSSTSQTKSSSSCCSSLSLGIEDYSRETDSTLRSNDSQLNVLFEAGDYTTVETDDGQYVDQDISDEYATFLFRDQDQTKPELTVHWNGQSNVAPSASTVYLQIYNRNTTEWETLDSEGAEDADTDFDLNGSVTENLTNYYDASGWVACRVYQQKV